MSDQSEQLGLPVEGFELASTPEEIAGKIANTIFRPWYKEYYEGRYTQSTAFIAKVLKQAVLSCVVNGDDNEELIARAMTLLGRKQQVVTDASMQYAISHTRQELKRRGDAGAWKVQDDASTMIQDFDALFMTNDEPEGDKEARW